MTTTTTGTQRTAARSDRLSHKPSTPETVLVALADRPETTAEQLAAAAGLGRSAVAKALAALDAEHRVVRITGGRDRGRRLADRWSLPPATPTTEQPPSAGEDPVPLRPAGDRGGEGRLGRGQLLSLVADRLAGEPDREFTPSHLGGLLGRSAGAVGNALARMVENGQAVQTSVSPRRYRHARASGR